MGPDFGVRNLQYRKLAAKAGKNPTNHSKLRRLADTAPDDDDQRCDYDIGQ